MEQMGIVGEEGILSSSTRDQHKSSAWHGDYVIIALVAKAAETILETQQALMTGPADALYSQDGFRRTFGAAVDAPGGVLSELDADVLLKYLERDRQVVVHANGVSCSVRILPISSDSQRRSSSSWPLMPTPKSVPLLRLTRASWNSNQRSRICRTRSNPSSRRSTSKSTTFYKVGHLLTGPVGAPSRQQRLYKRRGSRWP